MSVLSWVDSTPCSDVSYCLPLLFISAVNIGYAFVNILLRRDDGKIGVDLNLLNDVVEQNGGGNEPFTDVIEPDLLNAAADRVATTRTVVQDHIIGTAEDTTERIKAKVVQFKDITASGRDENADSEEIEATSNENVHTMQGALRPGAKKDV